jgi:hypothetical protein
MRHLLLLLLFSCVYITAASQKKKTRFDLEFFDALKFKLLPVEIKTKGKPSLQTHFNVLIVHDFRADKSKLGFARAGEKIEDRRFVFPGEEEDYLGKKINKLFSCNSHSQDTLVLALKNLWLFQTQQQAGVVKRELLGEIQLISHCFINGDVYAYKNGITTILGTIDTVISTNGWIVNRGNDLLKETLLTSLTICDSMFQTSPATARPDLMKPDVDFPVFSVGHPKKGIYFSFQDFLNNNPDTASFETEIKTKKRGLKSSIYTDSIISKCWGYSDESGIYMNINNDYYRLNRSQNAFDLRAPVLVDIKNSMFSKIFRTATSYFLIDRPLVDPSELGKAKNSTLEFFKYYQLDTYTGSLK